MDTLRAWFSLFLHSTIFSGTIPQAHRFLMSLNKKCINFVEIGMEKIVPDAMLSSLHNANTFSHLLSCFCIEGYLYLRILFISSS